MDVAADLFKRPPPKKKKRFILFLFNASRIKDGIMKTIEAATSTNDEAVLLRMEDKNEALKLLMVKNIDLTIIDESFIAEREDLMRYSIVLKERKKSPIFYITSDIEDLVHYYRKYMYMYEELDDYLPMPLDFHEASKRIKRALVMESRAAKRYELNLKLRVQRIDTGEFLDAQLSNISALGAGFTVESDMKELFRMDEQIRIFLPIGYMGIFHEEYGETLKLAARVKRFNLDGRRLGCAFMYVTPMQQSVLNMMIKLVDVRLKSIKQLANKKKPAVLSA